MSTNLNSDAGLRLLALAGVAVAAHANRRHFGLTTTWLPHLVGNGTALLAPELYRLASAALDLDGRLARHPSPLARDLRRVADRGVASNPDYGAYVTPLALAYVVSHPKFNIYRGDWGRRRIGPFGLDTLPHASTAFTLTALTYDVLAALDDADDRRLRSMAEHPVAVSALVLAGLTLVYELGEYVIHRDELRRAGGRRDRINMLWSPEDTLGDVLSNAAGWAVATLRRMRTTR